MARYFITGRKWRENAVAFRAALAANAHKGDAAMVAALETAANMGRRVGEALNERREPMEREASLAQLDLIDSLKRMVPDASTTQIGRVVTMSDASRAIDYLHSCMGGVTIRPETRSRIFVLLKADAYGADKDSMKLSLDIDTLGQGGNERDGQRAIRWLEARARSGPDDGFARPATRPSTAVSTGRPRHDPRRKPSVRVAPASAPQPVAVTAAVEDVPVDVLHEDPDFVPYIDGDVRYTARMLDRHGEHVHTNWETYDRRNDLHDNPGYHFVPWLAEPCRVSRPIPAGTVTWLCEDQSIPADVLAAGRYERLVVAPVPAPAPVVTAPRPARVVPGRPATLPPARPATPKPYVRPFSPGNDPSDWPIPF